MKKAAVFLAEGFEEIEALTPVDVCRRAGVEVTTVSITTDHTVVSSHGIPVSADKLFEEVDYDEMDLLLIPGGGEGTKNLEKCDKLNALLVEADKKEKLLAAICAGPRVLGKLGLLKGHKATCYPGNEEFLEGADCVKEKVVLDGRFITAVGMGASLDFGLSVAKALVGAAVADEVKAKLQY